jgi:Mrp family chromosome partitioning ATPase
VIIDLPPILGVAETIRLATAADNIALVIRWGRTERQFVQFALDALRRASASPIAVILNDIDLKAQRRRGYSDGTSVYTDKELYRAAPEYGEPAVPASLSMAAAEPAAHSEAGKSEPQRDDAPCDGPRPAGSAIERWYEKYQG